MSCETEMLAFNYVVEEVTGYVGDLFRNVDSRRNLH